MENPMEAAIFYVRQSEAGWTIRLKETDYGPCPSWEAAIEAATRAAVKAHRRGHFSQVMMYVGHRYRTVWMAGDGAGRAAA
jgi:hypothetical protein